jgi:hypothetical protein
MTLSDQHRRRLLRDCSLPLQLERCVSLPLVPTLPLTHISALGTNPTCITGLLVWTHGTYALQTNGSIVLTPFGDGYQQVQDPCAAVSNFVQDYNYTELISYWRIFHDGTTGGNKLHLWDFDGTPMAPQFQVSTTANMLPTQKLRNSTQTLSRRSFIKRAFTGGWWDN